MVGLTALFPQLAHSIFFCWHAPPLWNGLSAPVRSIFLVVYTCFSLTSNPTFSLGVSHTGSACRKLMLTALLTTTCRDKAFLIIVMQFSIGKIKKNTLGNW